MASACAKLERPSPSFPPRICMAPRSRRMAALMAGVHLSPSHLAAADCSFFTADG